MTTHSSNLCMACARLDRHTIGYEDTPKCEAYPNAIPVEIFYGGADHRLPREDDNGKHFVMSEEFSFFFDFWAATQPERTT